MPLELQVEITFEDVEGKTRLSLEHCGMPDKDMREMRKAGWCESFDKLAECLS